MKKLLTLVLAAVLMLSLASCGGKEECILLFENDGDVFLDEVLSFDLDEDNKEDTINVKLTADYYIDLTVDNSSIKLGDEEAYYIDKIYVIDLDRKEKGMELAIISEELSSDMMLRILKPEGNTFRLYEFESVDAYSGEPYIWDTLSLGYEPEISFEGGVLKTSERGRTGMWCVEAKYAFDGEVFRKVEMDEKKVVRSSFEGLVSSWEKYSNELIAEGYFRDEAEFLNLKDGYITARADFENYGEVPEHKDMITLSAGDLFKVTKENSEGFVFIEKKSGESGWIYMGDFMDNRHEVSEIAFHMAD